MYPNLLIQLLLMLSFHENLLKFLIALNAINLQYHFTTKISFEHA